MKETTFVFNPLNIQRAEQLETVAQRIFQARSTTPAEGVGDPWLNYTDTDGHVQFYKVTPQTMWGMMLVRQTLYQDIAEATGQALIEKYLKPGEVIPRKKKQGE